MYKGEPTHDPKAKKETNFLQLTIQELSKQCPRPTFLPHAPPNRDCHRLPHTANQSQNAKQ